jgi:hypothetical protein
MLRGVEFSHHHQVVTVAFHREHVKALPMRDRSSVKGGLPLLEISYHVSDRSVVRLADRESGLSARTIARRLPSVSGLYASPVWGA